MRPHCRLSEEERPNETHEALVPPKSSEGSFVHPFDKGDDAKPREDKITICETILLSLQHFMVAASRCVLAVLYISPSLCLLSSDPIRGLLLARFLALSGITTLLQTTKIGVGLPLAYATCLPTMVAISLVLTPSGCPSALTLEDMDDDVRALVVAPRLGKLQGALLVTSLVGLVISVAARFIPSPGRPVLAAAVSLAGAVVALKPVADVVDIMNWPTALIVAAVAAFLAMIRIPKSVLPLPLPACSARKGFHFHWHPVGAVCVFLTVMGAWITCWICTATGLFADNSSLSTSVDRPDRMVGTFTFLVPSICWGEPSVELYTTLAVLAGFLVGMLLNWGSWTAVSAATQTHDANGSVPGSWRGLLVYAISAALAGLIGAPAPVAGGADTAGVAFFAKTAGSRAAGLTPLRVCGVLLVIISLVPSVAVVVCSAPIPAVMGASLLLIASSGGAGLLYLEHVNLKAFNPRLLLGLVLLATLTYFMYRKF